MYFNFNAICVDRHNTLRAIIDYNQICLLAETGTGKGSRALSVSMPNKKRIKLKQEKIFTLQLQYKMQL